MTVQRKSQWMFPDSTQYHRNRLGTLVDFVDFMAFVGACRKPVELKPVTLHPCPSHLTILARPQNTRGLWPAQLRAWPNTSISKWIISSTQRRLCFGKGTRACTEER